LALISALLLAGCGERTEPASDTATGGAVTAGPLTTAPTAAETRTAAAGTEIDEQSAASIEQSVEQAQSLLTGLDRDFQEDGTESG
jgi:hypothetical protein